MRRSSSRSEPPRLLDGALARGPVRDAVSDAAWLSALLTVEAALTWVQAEVGLVPQAAAEAIAAACRPERFDVAALGRIAAQGGNPVIPLVETLRGAVGPTQFVVFVNGQLEYADGQLTGVKSGRPLRGPGWKQQN